MKKRGYFFIVDSMVALAVLTVGIVLIFSFFNITPRTEQTYTISEDILNILQNNKIRDINNVHIDILRVNGNITETNKPVLEQLAEFYFRGQKELIPPFLHNVTEDLFPSEYNYMLSIDNVSVYNDSQLPMEGARYIVPARTITHGMYGAQLYGPYSVEVLSWG